MKPYYNRGGVRIYHGDAREVLADLPARSVDLVLTDPPYGHNNNNNGDLIHRREVALGLPKKKHGKARPIANDGPEANDLARWLFAEAARILKPGACCCCCCGGGGPDPQFARWSLWLDGAGEKGERLRFKQMVVWDKGGLGMGWHYRRNYETILVAEKQGAKCRWFGGHKVANVIREKGLRPGPADHPTPKPEALFARFVEWHTEPGDLVVDPFLGGGTSLVVAQALGRQAIGVDVDERWCELAAKRLGQAPQGLWASSRAR